MGGGLMKRNRLALALVIVICANCFIGVQAFGKNKVLKVISMSPKSNSINIKVDSAVEIKFSVPLRKGRNFSEIKLISQKSIKEKTNVQINGASLIIKPKSAMKYNTFYSVILPKASIIGKKGELMKDNVQIRFKTIPQGTKKSDSTKDITDKINPSDTGGAAGGDNKTPNTKEADDQKGSQGSTSSVTTPASITTSSGITPGQDLNPSNTNTTGSGIGVNNSDTGVQSKGIAVHGFYSGYTKYSSDTENYLRGLDSVSFAWLMLDNTNGNVDLKTNTPNYDFHVPSDYSKPLKFCKDNNIKAQIAIYSDGNVAKAVISNSDARRLLINKIINALKMKMDNGEEFDFNGVVIDFEGFKQSDTSVYFNTFLQELKAAMVPIDKKLYVALDVRRYYKGYDYKTILKYADKVILMAHDYEPFTSLSKTDLQRYMNYSASNSPNTLSPYDKVKIDLEDLINSINDISDKKKIWLQISFATMEWSFPMASPGDWTTLDGSAVGIRSIPSYPGLLNRLYNTNNQEINLYDGYIKELESPYITYYDTAAKTFNFTLLEDNRSVQAKFDLAHMEGIDGISLWRLGSIPNYNDDTGKKYYLDIWDKIKNIKY